MKLLNPFFGKQKYIERDYKKEGFTSLILSIGAVVGETTTYTITKALTTTPVKTVIKWCKDKLGTTVQSKKSTVYNNTGIFVIVILNQLIWFL